MESQLVGLLAIAVTVLGGGLTAYVVLRERIKGVESGLAATDKRVDEHHEAITGLHKAHSDTREVIAGVRGTLEQLVHRIDDVLAEVRRDRT